MIVDLGLPDMPGIDMIEQVRKLDGVGDLPVVVYTGMEISKEDEARLAKLAETVIVKGAESPDRLFDETALFLHRTLEALPEAKRRRLLVHFQRADYALKGRKVLIIDDDVRNIFSLTSALERHGVNVVFAENGAEGIRMLRQVKDVDVVLVDIMMPEMDGYETMRAIRAMDGCASLPMIAVTAKAMKGDREKCLDAGATDYIAKPVDIDQLVSMLRVYVSRPAATAVSPAASGNGTGGRGAVH
jgi:CheY-like chemotaxis protein